ncbi:peptidylprolyl isomerase [Phenylobacterium sp.]|jgi:peptidyl-prolyl cis-trans isomerase A (cyclophilin A)|uniref:peptidylprolyl isomerase n=1 Tax=Phenylobacterium sp. TaxID=1871053 RepID=UPI002F3E8B6B
MKRRDVLAAAGVLAALPALARAQAPVPPVRVALKTGQGLIVLELYPDKAPITAGNFLHYVDAKRYDGATIYRASHAPTAPEIGLVQGGLQNDPARIFKPVAHESTLQTGLRHRDGTISLARRAQGSATSDFFICVGDASYLDADPSQPGDNAGFAAFGQVAEGMDVVRKILTLPTSATGGGPEMKGEMLAPPVPILTVRRAA